MSNAKRDSEAFQRQVDAFFLEASKNGWDESRLRRKLEDTLRKVRTTDPTLFRRAMYTMAKILGIDPKPSRHYGGKDENQDN